MVDARAHTDSNSDLHEIEKDHLNKLLDKGEVIPNAMNGANAVALKKLIARNPLSTPCEIFSEPIPKSFHFFIAPVLDCSHSFH